METDRDEERDRGKDTGGNRDGELEVALQLPKGKSSETGWHWTFYFLFTLRSEIWASGYKEW